MRVKALAAMYTQFRRRFRIVDDELREKNLIKYYSSLIQLNQAFPLFHESGVLIALCEVWKLKEDDIDSMINKKEYPESISDGDVIFVANITLDPNFYGTGVFKFYRRFLNDHIFKEGYKKTFWYNPKRKRFSRVFRGKPWPS